MCVYFGSFYSLEDGSDWLFRVFMFSWYLVGLWVREDGGKVFRESIFIGSDLFSFRLGVIRVEVNGVMGSLKYYRRNIVILDFID